MERELILQTLSATGNNKTRAAELLGISLKTLHNKLKEYGSERAEAEYSAPCSWGCVTKLTLVMTGLVFLVVAVLSVVFLGQLLQQVLHETDQARQRTGALSFSMQAQNALADAAKARDAACFGLLPKRSTIMCARRWKSAKGCRHS